MALEDLSPSNRFELALSGDMTAEEASNRIEKILAGADIEPSNRLEYFLKLRVSGGGGGGGGKKLVFTYLPDENGVFPGGNAYRCAQIIGCKMTVIADCEGATKGYLFDGRPDTSNCYSIFNGAQNNLPGTFVVDGNIRTMEYVAQNTARFYVGNHYQASNPADAFDGKSITVIIEQQEE